MKISKTLIAAILLLSQLSFALQIGSAHHASQEDEDQEQFCWKDKYAKVQSNPSFCGALEYVNGRCQDKCSQGYVKINQSCLQACPSGFIDKQGFCQLVSYSRGTGYISTPPPIQNLKAVLASSLAKCQSDLGVGNCVEYVNNIYPKCKLGFTNSGCCKCVPITNPNCAAVGLISVRNLPFFGCLRRVYSIVRIPPTCPPGQQRIAGKCSKPCPNGYTDDGFNCQAPIPKGWVSCGLTGTKDGNTCSIIQKNTPLKLIVFFSKSVEAAKSVIREKTQEIRKNSQNSQEGLELSKADTWPLCTAIPVQ